MWGGGRLTRPPASTAVHWAPPALSSLESKIEHTPAFPHSTQAVDYDCDLRNKHAWTAQVKANIWSGQLTMWIKMRPCEILSAVKIWGDNKLQSVWRFMLCTWEEKIIWTPTFSQCGLRGISTYLAVMLQVNSETLLLALVCMCNLNEHCNAVLRLNFSQTWTFFFFFK